MLTKIIDFSLGNKLIIALFTLGLILYGSLELSKLPIDAVPDITNNQIQVITTAPSYGATDIERLVTFPIEQNCNNIPGLSEIRSFSRFGLSIVTIVFEDGIDIYWARQQVSERLQSVKEEIPQGISPPTLGPVTTGLGEIFQYVVRTKKGYEHKYSLTDLRTIQDWQIRRRLLGVKGVAEVSSFGGKLKQYEIAVDPQRLLSHQITLQEIFDVLAKNNQNTGGSYIEKGPTVMYIRSEGLLKAISDISDIAIRHTAEGTPITIGDVADVQLGHATRFGAMCYNENGEVAGAIVMMLKGANSNVVIGDVKAKIEEIQKTLPEGVVIEPFLDRTKMVNNAISTVKTNLLEGALIVIFILVLFLGNLRAGLLVASVIPLSLLFAAIMMNLFGVSGNLMSLGALDFGLIVDGAVIIVEAVLHQMMHKMPGLISRKEMNHEVRESSGRMMNSAVFGQIIILIVYLPIFSLEGIEGKMFKPMAQTVAFALLGAFLLSITYIPVMSSWVLNRKTGPTNTFSDRLMAWIEKLYIRSLTTLLKFPKIVLTSTFVLFLISIFVLTRMGGEFIPSLEEGDFAVETRVLNGSNLNTTIEETQKAVKILRDSFPEIEKIVTKIGSGEVPTDPMPIDAADMMIILKPKDEWTSAKTFPELADKMQLALGAVPSVSTGFQYPVQMRFNELITGAKQDVVCKIFGENLDTLQFYAARLAAQIQQLDGTADLYVEPIEGLPQLVVTFNRAYLAQHGISVEQANEVINTAFAGKIAGKIQEGEKRFDLVLRLQSDKRLTADDIKNITVLSTNHGAVPLSAIADVNIIYGPGQIQRIDTRRRVVVGFNVRGRDVQSVVQDLQKLSQQQLRLPEGYFVEFGGAFENLNHAKRRLMIAVPISLLLILFLLYMAFHSFKHALLIYSAIPLSAIGGILFLALRGMPFSISAGIGFIALFGVAVLNGLVLIAEFRRIHANAQHTPMEVVLKGTRSRLRPVLMTAMVASLGFLPMALSNGAGAEVQRPLATVVIGGLIMATFLTLIVLPMLYMNFEKFSVKDKVGKIPTLLLFLFLSGMLLRPAQLQAQTPISLQAALERAAKQHPDVVMAGLKESESKLLIKASFDAPQTAVGLNYGQFNSVYRDIGVNAAQSLNFPSYYVHQKKSNSAQYAMDQQQSILTLMSAKTEVTTVYCQLLGMTARERQWLSLDSLFSRYIDQSIARNKNGESTELETISLKAKQQEIRHQLAQLAQEYQAGLRQFNILIGGNGSYAPQLPFPNPDLKIIAQQDSGKTHPTLEWYAANIQKQSANVQAEQSLLLPGLQLGYYNNSIQGMGADNRVYGVNDRFHSVSLGVGIPLFPSAQVHRIAASKLEVDRASTQLQKAQSEHEAYRKSLRDQFTLRRTQLAYLETDGLKHAAFLEQSANLQYSVGAISFIEWTNLIEQSYEIKLNHIEALIQYHLAYYNIVFYENL